MSDDIVDRLRKRMIRRELGDDPLVKVFGDAADEIEKLRATLRNIRARSSQMAEDDGLWFGAATAAEAYVQQELRALCAVIEGVSPDECARAALGEAKVSDDQQAKAAAERIVAAIAGIKGKRLAVAFQDEQTAKLITHIIEDAAKVARAYLAREDGLAVKLPRRRPHG